MVMMLKLDWKFKTTMINMLRAVMDKVGCMQENMGNVRHMKILRKKCNEKTNEECL